MTVRLDRATAAGAVAIALWSLLALLSRASADVPPFQLTAMTFGVSAALGLAWLAWRGELSVLRQPPLAWLHGVGGLFGYHALFFAALAHAPPVEANLLNYTWPLLIVLLSAPLLGMRLTGQHLLGVAAGLSGSLLLLARGAHFDADSVLGYLCAAGAALTWALYSVLARRMAGVPSAAVAGFCGGSAVAAAVAHAMFETVVMPSGPVIMSILLLGLGPVGIAFVLWDIGMKRGDPRLLGTLAYATPVASTIVLGLAGYASLSPLTLVAALLVAAGGLIAARAG